MTNSWLKAIEAAFEERLGLRGVRAEFAPGPIPHQAAVTVHVPTSPTPAMHALAQEIEAEHAELDQAMWVRIKRD